jgi:hypothetical protein
MVDVLFCAVHENVNSSMFSIVNVLINRIQLFCYNFGKVRGIKNASQLVK